MGVKKNNNNNKSKQIKNTNLQKKNNLTTSRKKSALKNECTVSFPPNLYFKTKVKLKGIILKSENYLMNKIFIFI